MHINKVVASGNGNRILTQKLKVQMHIIIDRHIGRQKLNYYLLPNPPNFLLLSAFKHVLHDYKSFYVFILF
jgi:hypothetical protein